jgi:hypothetical protein
MDAEDIVQYSGMSSTAQHVTKSEIALSSPHI